MTTRRQIDWIARTDGTMRQRVRRYADITATPGIYRVDADDVRIGVCCTGCHRPFARGEEYTHRGGTFVICLECAAPADERPDVALDDPVINYGQDRDLPDPEGWVATTIPVVVVEGMQTGDGRLIPPGSIEGHRALPIPLLSLSRTTEGGHLDASIVGRIDHLERVPGPEVMNIDTGEPFPEGTFVWRSNEAYIDPEHPDYPYIYKGALNGLSVDLAETEADFEASEDDPDGEPILMLRRGRIAASTICTIPAFPGAHPVLSPDAPAPGATSAPEPVAASAGPAFRLEHESGLCASCAAPPRAWFSDPGLSEATPLTVTEEGRIYGHVAAWSVCHIGLPGCTTAPRSPSGYAYFLTGSSLTSDGGEVPVGRLTLGTGHADLSLGAAATTEHYDNTGTCVADVAAGEDAHGIWIAGAVRTGVTEDQVRVLRASPPSGDWRPIGGALELVGVLLVNVPGFPLPRPRARVASGVPKALVAAGALSQEVSRMATPPPPRTRKPPTEGPAPDASEIQSGDMVSIQAGSDPLIGHVTEVAEDAVTVEVLCHPDMVSPAAADDAVSASGERLDTVERTLRAVRAGQLVARIPRNVRPRASGSA